jgi:glycosyltransferase involved in cell wall biosynthesis
LISVILPNYNHAAFLQERIDSILFQTYEDFELIILDDCSSDNSREIIEKYKDHRKVSHIVYNNKNSGSPFKQWKKGIDLAKGEFIWIAESDDWSDKNFLVAIAPFLSEEQVSLAYCRSFGVYENNQQVIFKWGEIIEPSLWEKDQTFKGKEFIDTFLKYRNVIPNASAVVFKKKYFKDIDKLFQMRYAGDWLLWVKIAEKGDIAYCSKPFNYFRFHDASTRGRKSFMEERRKIREYFISILEACRKAGCRFNSFDKNYSYMIINLINETKVSGIKVALWPPFPFLFRMKFYYAFVKSKMAALFHKK